MPRTQVVFHNIFVFVAAVETEIEALVFALAHSAYAGEKRVAEGTECLKLG